MAHPAKAHSLPHLRELDGMRGIAALLVFFHHLGASSVPAGHWPLAIRVLRRLCELGTAGVDVFFVLSGFLITSLLIRDRAAPGYYRDFYWKRALRILPVYLLCLLGVFLFIPHSGGYVLLSILFLANFANVFHIEAIGPFWSLAIEEQFYLLWPTVVRRRSVATLGHWALSIAAGSVFLRFASAATGHHNYFLTWLRCDGLAFGALLACRFHHSQRERVPLSRYDPVFFAAIFIGALLCSASLVPGDGSALLSAIIQTGVAILCAGLIGLLVGHAGSRALSPLRGRTLTFFGLISYAFYMVHPYVMLAYDHLRGPLPIGNATAYATRLATVFAVAIVISLALRYLVELPALSLRRHVLKAPAPQAEIESPLLASP